MAVPSTNPKAIIGLTATMADERLPEPFNCTDPFELFDQWLAAAIAANIVNPNAMCLSTLNETGSLSSRHVLLKGHGPDGFVFYTNFGSRKGAALVQNRQASLCFYWRDLTRQITVDGTASPVSDELADTYFASRPRDSQIGAWASYQSKPLANRAELGARYDQTRAKFDGVAVPRPPHWSGFRIAPSRIEFWHGRDSRLHDRLAFEKTDVDWQLEWLNP